MYLGICNKNTMFGSWDKMEWGILHFVKTLRDYPQEHCDICLLFKSFESFHIPDCVLLTDSHFKRNHYLISSKCRIKLQSGSLNLNISLSTHISLKFFPVKCQKGSQFHLMISLLLSVFLSLVYLHSCSFSLSPSFSHSLISSTKVHLWYSKLCLHCAPGGWVTLYIPCLAFDPSEMVKTKPLQLAFPSYPLLLLPFYLQEDYFSHSPAFQIDLDLLQLCIWCFHGNSYKCN